MRQIKEFIDSWAAVLDINIKLPPKTPIEVIKDVSEAKNCLEIGAARASATMSRRALQHALLDIGADSKKDLQTQIDEMDAAKKISHSLAQMAHGVRYLGNYGAHPNGDLLKDVNIDDAELGHSIILKIIEQLYT